VLTFFLENYQCIELMQVLPVLRLRPVYGPIQVLSVLILLPVCGTHADVDCSRITSIFSLLSGCHNMYKQEADLQIFFSFIPLYFLVKRGISISRIKI
jgi:hypothetical protein